MDAPQTVFSTCPHDCPSQCALEVERLDPHTIGRVRGATSQRYTDGVICAKVAHAFRWGDLITRRRTGAKLTPGQPHNAWHERIICSMIVEDDFFVGGDESNSI